MWGQCLRSNMSLNTEMKQKPEHIQEISENQESDRTDLLLVFQ